MSRAWDKEKEKNPNNPNPKSPTGFEPMTSQTPGRCSIHSSFEELIESEILGSYLTHILHTARISNVNVVMCGERMQDGKF